MTQKTYAPLKPVLVGNASDALRDAFESYSPSGQKWVEVKDSGDIIQLDGNAVAASYLVISKDPLTADTVASITGVQTLDMPFDFSVGLSRSQAALGQEFSVEVIDPDTTLDTVADVAISTISQTTTTLSVTTATAHGLVVGKRIGISGCTDSRFNYPALVVATTPTATTFTATAGPGGTIPSVTAGPFTSGVVFFRPSLGYSGNGTSMIFENATATNASFYIRSEAGDSLPSGTVAGSHVVTVGTTASVQAVNAALNYAFQPTTEYRCVCMIDSLQWTDNGVDSLTVPNNRVKRTQVIPSSEATYKLRVRATNNKSLTVPVAQIVSAAKTGTTTVTVTTNVPHGLTTGDFVNTYGARDTTNFPNLTTATAVASTPTSTTFTVVWGGAVTATTYGGYVSRVNGGQVQQGALTMAAQSVSVTAGVINLVGSATWSGTLIGDYVNLVGIRDNTTGATLNLDGAYRVRDIQTTSLFLEPIGTTPTPATITSTNCGGGVIKRTDLRISFTRVLDFTRHRVEMTPRPVDAALSVPVQITGATTFTQNVQGAQANNATTVPSPVLSSVVGLSANPAAGTTARQQQTIGTLIGVPIMRPFSIPEGDWNYAAAASGIVNTTTAVTFKAAAAAGLKNYITSIDIMSEALGTATELVIRNGASGTVIWRMKIGTGGLTVGRTINFPTPLQSSAATLLEVATLTASGTGAVYFNAQGYVAP